MIIKISYTESRARDIKFLLRKRYKSEAGLIRLCKLAIHREVVEAAKDELKKLGIIKDES